MEKIEKTRTMHNQAKENSHSNANNQALSFVVVAIVVVVLVFMSAPVSLNCARTEAHGPVNCTKQTRLLWIFPLPEENIYNVVDAHLASVPGDEYCDPCYRVRIRNSATNSSPQNCLHKW